MTAGIIDGTNLRVYIGITPIAYATACVINLERETRSVIHKDNPGGGWQESNPGGKSGNVQIDALYNEDGTANTYQTPRQLFDALDNGTLLVCTAETGTAGDNIISFSAYLTNLEINASVDENASYSATFTISGAVTMSTT